MAPFLGTLFHTFTHTKEEDEEVGHYFGDFINLSNKTCILLHQQMSSICSGFP